MKRIFTFFTIVFLIGICLPQVAEAQSPEKISYQAVIRNSSNDLITNTSVGMQISILQGSASGAVMYSETQTPTTNANGLVSIEIGEGTVVAGVFANIDWTNGPFFIKTETDPSGGTSYTISGTSQLLSVPYALHAKSAESITGPLAETDPIFGSSQAANITAADIANLSNLSGTNTGDQDISGIATNASDISAIQAEQTAQDAAIAVNTAKVGLTPAQVTVLGNTSGVNTGDQDLSGLLSLDEAPGVDWVSGGGGSVISTSSGSSLINSVTITAPDNGYVIVTASGTLYHSVASTASFTARVKVSTTANDITETPGIQFIRRSVMPTGTPTIMYPYSVSQVFPVSAGNRTFHLNIWHQTVNGTLRLDDYTLIAHFVPFRY